MKTDVALRPVWTQVWIPAGAGLFIVALIVSAVVVPQLRLLHLLQSMIYVAVVVLSRRHHAGAFGAGIAVGAVWNSLNLFITHLMQAGAREAWAFVRTGHVNRPDTMMVALGGAAHFVLIVACAAAFLQANPGRKDWARFAVGGAVALAYFAMIIAVAAPR